MFKKELPIIFIGLCMVIAVLVLSWTVFVKEEMVVPVQAPVVEDGNGETVSDDVDDDISEVDTSDWKTYQNGRYGFEFDYPLYYTLEKGTNNYALLCRTEHKKTAWSFNLAIKQNRFDSELSFEEFATKSALDGCAVDDSNKNTYCTEVVEIKPFVNKNKISGYEIYLNEVTEDSLGNKMSNRTKGPIFAMDVFEQTQSHVHARGIFFDFDGKEDEGALSKQEKQKLTDQVISTLKFTEEKDDTANWRTYKNEKYGYEFKYPHEWNAVSNEHNTGTVLLGSEATKESSNGGIEYDGTLKQEQTFEDFVKEFSTAGLGSDFEVEELINGYNVIVNIIPSANIHIMRETKIVSFENNREVFSLYFSHRANFGKYPEDRHELDFFDQVVSSFKFTEK